MKQHENGWEAGEIPWVQAALVGSADASSGYAQCYFCGEMTAKLSIGNLGSDKGRVEVYCNSSECDAREMAVIVLRDGAHAIDRSDVRILRAIDENNRTEDEKPIVLRTFGDLMSTPRNETEILDRRVDAGPATYAVPGAGRWASLHPND